MIGDRGLKEGKLEVKWRWEKDAQKIDLPGAADLFADWIRDEHRENKRFRSRGE